MSRASRVWLSPGRSGGKLGRNLDVVDPYAHLRYVMDAVSQIRKALANEVPLIGFAGSPYTLACYMIEGRGGTEFHEIKRMLYSRPDLLHTILEINARSVIAYLNAQIEAGAQAVGHGWAA